MSASKFVQLYLVTTAVFFAFDFVWLSTATSRIYKPLLGDLLAENPRLGVAAGFYLLYVVGIVVFAVIPGAQEGSAMVALWRGALFGFLAYATYDLTNLATIEGWPWKIAAIDMVWGTVLNAATAFVGYHAANWLKIL